MRYPILRVPRSLLYCVALLLPLGSFPSQVLDRGVYEAVFPSTPFREFLKGILTESRRFWIQLTFYSL
jgi:hypothetical protein